MKTHLRSAAAVLIHPVGDVGADHLPAGHHCNAEAAGRGSNHPGTKSEARALMLTRLPPPLVPCLSPGQGGFRSDPGVAADSSALRPGQLCRRSEHFTRDSTFDPNHTIRRLPIERHLFLVPESDEEYAWEAADMAENKGKRLGRCFPDWQ